MNDKYTPEEAVSLVRKAIFDAIDNSQDKRVMPDLVVAPNDIFDQFMQFKRPEEVNKITSELFGGSTLGLGYLTFVIPSEHVKEIECYERMKTKNDVGQTSVEVIQTK